jgi:hypothetical protein
MKRKPYPADQAVVRTWANDQDWRDDHGRQVADVGRFPSSLVEDFNNDPANKAAGLWYEEPRKRSRPPRYQPKKAAPEPEDDLIEVRLLIPRSIVSSILPEQSRSRKSERH